jgi:hypothetical protein
MHDGSLATLSDVMDFYDRGGIDNPGKDALLGPLHLTIVEKQQLAAFLLTLTSDQAARLAGEAPRGIPFAQARMSLFIVWLCDNSWRIAAPSNVSRNRQLNVAARRPAPNPIVFGRACMNRLNLR